MNRLVWAATGIVLALVAIGCSNGGDGAEPAPEAAANAGSGNGLDRCGLLTDGEIEAVIGAHDGGSNELTIPAIYGAANSCLWTATGGEQHPDGSYNAIEVSVLEGDLAGQERANVEADTAAQPVEGFVETARWNDLGGARLWFDCPGGRLCHVRVNTASPETVAGQPRRDAAIQLGRHLLDRL